MAGHNKDGRRKAKGGPEEAERLPALRPRPVVLCRHKVATAATALTVLAKATTGQIAASIELTAVAFRRRAGALAVTL